MKRLLHIVLIVVVVLSLSTASDTAQAQPQLTQPRVSQAATVSQTVGLTEIAITYHRPSARDRTIWGDVVPYDQVWRTGANENTTISFSTPVRIQGHELPAGTYGLHTVPGEDAWTVIFSSNHWSWGSFNYREEEDALRIQTTPQSADFLETMQISFPEVTASSATTTIHWGEVRVPFTIDVDVHETVFAQFRQEFDNVQGFFPQNWRQAALYALQNDVNHDEALAWIDRAMQAQPSFGNARVKAGLLEQMGQPEEARALIDEYLPQATESEINAYGYQLMNAGQLDQAIVMFQRNVKQHPESWNVYDSLGEAYANSGEHDKAITHYEKALSMAPQNQHARINGILATLRQAQ